MIALRAIALVVLLAGVASAGAPHIHAERCGSLDGAAIEAAVKRELALAPPAGGADVAVEIACGDPVHASIRVGDGDVREVDLGDEPVALRVKLVALAIIEELDTVEPPPAPLPLDPVAPQVERDPLAARPPVLPALHEVTVRAGVRMIAWDRDVLMTLGADLDVGPLRIGLVTALGQSRALTGTPYLFAVALSRTLACSHGDTALCIVTRVDVGLYGVSLSPSEAPSAAQGMTRHLYTDYSDVAIGLEARRDALGVRWLASVELGAGDGMLVEEPYLERVDGPFVSTMLGASW